MVLTLSKCVEQVTGTELSCNKKSKQKVVGETIYRGKL